jgi:hypothetical protein
LGVISNKLSKYRVCVVCFGGVRERGISLSPYTHANTRLSPLNQQRGEREARVMLQCVADVFAPHTKRIVVPISRMFGTQT